MKQGLPGYYIVGNKHEQRPERSNGQSGSYYNLYTEVRPAKSLRTRRVNFIREEKINAKEGFEAENNKDKKTEREKRGFKGRSDHFKGFLELDPNDMFEVGRVNFETGARELVIDANGKEIKHED